MSELLVFGEITNTHYRVLEAVEKTLEELKNNNSSFRGITELLLGESRQILPVVVRGTRASTLMACVQISFLWSKFEKLKLIKNMRIESNDQIAKKIAETLLKIGNNLIVKDEESLLKLEIWNNVNSHSKFIEKKYGDINENIGNSDWISERVILAPKNNDVDLLNIEVLSMLNGQERTYRSIYTNQISSGDHIHPREFLNDFDYSALPHHKLTLKIGVRIILIRNLKHPKLLNGTRMVVKNLGRNILSAQILMRKFKEEIVDIPRKVMISDKVIQFSRKKFPIKIAYAMTINKSQGHICGQACLNLENDVFSHGQLYVALSRIRKPSDLIIYSFRANKVKNIAFDELFTN